MYEGTFFALDCQDISLSNEDRRHFFPVVRGPAGEKVRTVLTVLMVVARSSLMVALNGLTGGFGVFIDRQFSSLAANVLTLTAAEGLEDGGGGVPQAPKITFNSAVVSRVNSLPFVNDVVPVYQGVGDVASSNVPSVALHR